MKFPLQSEIEMNPKGIHNLMSIRQIVSKPSLISSHYSICQTIPKVYSRVRDLLRLAVQSLSPRYLLLSYVQTCGSGSPLFVLLKSAENNLIKPNTTFECSFKYIRNLCELLSRTLFLDRETDVK